MYPHTLNKAHRSIEEQIKPHIIHFPSQREDREYCKYQITKGKMWQLSIRSVSDITLVRAMLLPKMCSIDIVIRAHPKTPKQILQNC